MSNLETIKTALTAEIKNAREGVAFYTKRIVELEKLQKQLGQLDIAEASAPSAKKGRSSVSSKLNLATAKAALVATAAPDGKGKSKTASKLPATKTAFWQGLLTDAPMANQEILAAATAALNIRPTPVDLQKLKQRLANFITIATKDGIIQSEGTGRARRFFAKKAE